MRDQIGHLCADSVESENNRSRHSSFFLNNVVVVCTCEGPTGRAAAKYVSDGEKFSGPVREVDSILPNLVIFTSHSGRLVERTVCLLASAYPISYIYP